MILMLVNKTNENVTLNMFTKNLYNSNFFRTEQIKQFKSTHFIDDTNLIFYKSNDDRQNPRTKRYFEHCLINTKCIQFGFVAI